MFAAAQGIPLSVMSAGLELVRVFDSTRYVLINIFAELHLMVFPGSKKGLGGGLCNGTPIKAVV